MPEAHWYFKLFNTIKEDAEVEFAELELSSLFGSVERVGNFADVLNNTPFKYFTKTSLPVQDIMAHELPYGTCQGFYAKTENIRDVSSLTRRLAYTREFLVVAPSLDAQELCKSMFPTGEIDKNVQYFEADTYSLIRFITNQYFLEKSQYISKLSRDENEVDNNVDALFKFLTKNLYRLPASATMQIGKRLEDYFTIREESSLHLTHYMHPYKGRFHPKMVRALLNCVNPKDKGLVMDNFAGCGTLLVEATWMGLDSVGIEINPLSALMSNVKCQSLTLDPFILKEAIQGFLNELREAFRPQQTPLNGESSLFPTRQITDGLNTERQRATMPRSINLRFRRVNSLAEISIAYDLVKNIESKFVREFILLALSGTISDMVRRRHGDFLEVFRDRLHDLYLRIYIFHKLNQVLKIRLGESVTHAADTRSMNVISTESVDAIVNSPPYSTALDYIRNDLPQLTILGLGDISKLEQEMIGNPNLKVYSLSLFSEINELNPEYARLPEAAKEIIMSLRKFDRTKEALRTYKFFKDMYPAVKEMHRVMKKGSKCAIIIGNNHYKLDSDYKEVRNDDILKKMAESIGFKEDRTIIRVLEKSRAGMIRYESILILSKPSEDLPKRLSGSESSESS
jgi:DNA modification methylase